MAWVNSRPLLTNSNDGLNVSYLSRDYLGEYSSDMSTLCRA